jgi:hypothetical protein
VLRATLMLFILKKNHLNATSVKYACYIEWRSSAMLLMCIACGVAGDARLDCAKTREWVREVDPQPEPANPIGRVDQPVTRPATRAGYPRGFPQKPAAT